MTYAVHTATCTYLLDEDGVCRSAVAPGGPPPPAAERCVGAQFVACLDRSAEGGLVGELRQGAAALFVRQEGRRFALLRTLPIVHVEIHDAVTMGTSPPDPVEDPATEPLAGLFDPSGSLPGERIDLEDLLSISVTEVIVSLPSRAPPDAAPPLPPWQKPPHPPPRRR
jgi:hypothetical protein